jgi:hypothetical protein
VAYLIPDNLKSRKDVSDAIRRVAQAFAVAFEDDTIVWYEPLFDPSGELPHLVVLEPRLGVVVLEVLKGKDKGKLLGAIRGRLRIEIDGEEQEVDNPLHRAERLAASLRSRLAQEPTLADVPVGAAAVLSGVDRAEATRLGVGNLVDLDVCVFKPDIDDAIHDASATNMLRALTRALGRRLDDELTDQQVAALRGVIHPDVVVQSRAEQGRAVLGELRQRLRRRHEGDRPPPGGPGEEPRQRASRHPWRRR